MAQAGERGRRHRCGDGEDSSWRQAVHLPHQEVGMAVEGNRGGERREASRVQMPHLRRHALGVGLRVAHPVGGVGERMGATGGAQVKGSLQVGPAV